MKIDNSYEVNNIFKNNPNQLISQENLISNCNIITNNLQLKEYKDEKEALNNLNLELIDNKYIFEGNSGKHKMILVAKDHNDIYYIIKKCL